MKTSVINLFILLAFVSCDKVNDYKNESFTLLKDDNSKSIVSISEICNDKKNGVTYIYTSDYRKFVDRTYSNGLLEGKSTHYYSNGKISYVEFYHKDKLHGEFVSYDEDGSINTEGKYENSEKKGVWNYYDNGILLLSEFYSDETITIIYESTDLPKIIPEPLDASIPN